VIEAKDALNKHFCFVFSTLLPLHLTKSLAVHNIFVIGVQRCLAKWAKIDQPKQLKPGRRKTHFIKI
jgi:hypothetical protein